MNIFYLDDSPKLAAAYHCDKHVVKQTLECAQILSTVQKILGNDNPILYKPYAPNHPCVKWALESKANYDWLYQLFLELGNEYAIRFNKTHKSIETLKDALKDSPLNISKQPFHKPPLVMPIEYTKIRDAVSAYRLYYVAKKYDLLHYTNRSVPDWINPYLDWYDAYIENFNVFSY